MSQPDKPASPEWLDTALRRLNFIMEGEISVADTDRGYCCLAHEIEFGPVELDLVKVSMPLPLGSDKKSGKLIYNVIVAEARAAGQHRVVHMMMDREGFQLSLTPYKKRKKWKREEPTE